jgi:hypothetical protein
VYGWRIFLGKDESTETGGELLWGVSDIEREKVVAANVDTGDIYLTYYKKYGIIETLDYFWEITPRYSPKPFVKEQGGTIGYRYNSASLKAETEIGVKRSSKRVLDPSMPAETAIARALYQNISYKRFSFSGTYLGQYYQDIVSTLSLSPSYLLIQNRSFLGVNNNLSLGANFSYQDTEQYGWKTSRKGISINLSGYSPKLNYGIGYRYDKTGITTKQNTGFLSGNISYRFSRDMFLSYSRSQSLLGLQKTESNFLNASYKNISTSISYSTSSYETNKSENLNIRLNYNSRDVGASIYVTKNKSITKMLQQNSKRTDTRKGWQLSLPQYNLTLNADFAKTSKRYTVSKMFKLKEYGRFISLNLGIDELEETTLQDQPAKYWLLSINYGY